MRATMVFFEEDEAHVNYLTVDEPQLPFGLVLYRAFQVLRGERDPTSLFYREEDMEQALPDTRLEEYYEDYRQLFMRSPGAVIDRFGDDARAGTTLVSDSREAGLEALVHMSKRMPQTIKDHIRPFVPSVSVAPYGSRMAPVIPLGEALSAKVPVELVLGKEEALYITRPAMASENVFLRDPSVKRLIQEAVLVSAARFDQYLRIA